MNARARLWLANCRLVNKRAGQPGALVLGHNATLIELRNCEFLGDSTNASSVRWNVPPEGRLRIENCCGVDGRALRVSVLYHEPKDVRVHLARITWRTK